jgi:hypothetical protein
MYTSQELGALTGKAIIEQFPGVTVDLDDPEYEIFIEAREFGGFVYDHRIAPYLDGSAFTEKHGYWGPGYGVPLHHLMLPFDIEKGGNRERAWPMALPPEGRTPRYESVWKEAARQVREHFDSRTMFPYGKACVSWLDYDYYAISLVIDDAVVCHCPVTFSKRAMYRISSPPSRIFCVIFQILLAN